MIPALGRLYPSVLVRNDSLTKSCGTTVSHNLKHCLFCLKIVFVLHIQGHTILTFLANSFSDQSLLQNFLLLHLNIFQFQKTPSVFCRRVMHLSIRTCSKEAMMHGNEEATFLYNNCSNPFLLL